MKNLAVLGVTGSIGRSTLDVIRSQPERFRLAAVAGGSRWKDLAEIARAFRPDFVAVADKQHLKRLKKEIKDLPCAVLGGPEGVSKAMTGAGADMLVSAAVGAAGLKPTLAAIDLGMDIALANKEILVMAGALVMEKVRQSGANLLPVDSEHSAVFQCLQCGPRREVARLLLTASGGPFRGRRREELERITAREALAHPTWSMGPKITVDSATLVNKALEVIEAHWLFGFEYDKIDVLVHPQSVVHSLVEFVDGSSIAQLGPADMRIPIQYALTYPERFSSRVPALDLAAAGSLTFERPDRAAFPCLDLGYKAGRLGGAAPAVFSAANETAVELFLHDRIRFLDIPELIRETLAVHAPAADPDLETILEADRWARAFALEKSRRLPEPKETAAQATETA